MLNSSDRPYVDIDNSLATVRDSLTVIQQAQLESALNYHALLHPGSLIAINVVIGSTAEVPALTSSSTLPGGIIDGLPVQHTVRVQSTARGQLGEELIERWVRLGHPDASPATTQPPAQFSLPRKVYRELEKRGPVMLDELREFIMRRRERAIAGTLARYPGDSHDSDIKSVYEAWAQTPHDSPAEARPAILFGLHWLQTGGAERWAVESIQIAKDAGFLPVVITDQNSVHPWADRAELDGCVVINLSFNYQEQYIDVAFMHALLENFNFAGVMVHHSRYLYEMLPWIKQHRPDLPVVDSLHIVEYLGGGYPGTAVHFDEFIDTHHVISPQLVTWMGNEQGVDRNKLALAPLATLTAGKASDATFKPRDAGKPLTIAFVGRLSRQKRPDVFLGLVSRLRKLGIDFHAIMHGDGEMRGIVDGLISQMKLDDVIEQRFEDVPVAQTLADSDLLVVTSINEGLTLTTFEALAAGIPVVSTDVGSQSTIVQDEALFPRRARPFIRGAADLITRLERDDTLRKPIWQAQQERVTEFSALPSAHQWMKEHFESWQA